MKGSTKTPEVITTGGSDYAISFSGYTKLERQEVVKFACKNCPLNVETKEKGLVCDTLDPTTTRVLLYRLANNEAFSTEPRDKYTVRYTGLCFKLH